MSCGSCDSTGPPCATSGTYTYNCIASTWSDFQKTQVLVPRNDSIPQHRCNPLSINGIQESLIIRYLSAFDYKLPACSMFSIFYYYKACLINAVTQQVFSFAKNKSFLHKKK